MSSAIQTVKDLLKAYVEKDRAAAERLVAAGFHFTSPLDNGLDRATYFDICWPNSEATDAFAIIHLAEVGDRVLVTYEGKARGKTFRNTEIHTVRDAQVVEVEVYFGWNVPHDVPAGEHRDPPGADQACEVASPDAICRSRS